MKSDVKFDLIYKGETGFHHKKYHLSELMSGIKNICDIHEMMDLVATREYVGLKDLNDKEIYEGDCFMDGESLVYVDYDVKNSCYVATWKGIPEWDSPVRLSGYVKNDIEIIGNIYENPELLSV